MSDSPAVSGAPPGVRNLARTLEIDTRLLGMIGAFVVLCLVFHFLDRKSVV